MPKHIVTAIGLVVSLGVIALGVFLVALPLYFQAVAVDGQTATVASTNELYQAQVDTLTAQQENLDEINANVGALRSQIPANGQLDDVFEVVGHAAEASGVLITAVTAGEQVGYTPRTGASSDDAVAADPTPAAEADAAANTSAVTPTAPTTDAASAGRQQVDFVISATAADIAQATVFLDALRAGPRLLNSVTATMGPSGGGGIDVQISALTYVDADR
ncbi:hypothetical protein ACLBXX_03355 [Microbacterium sp. C23T]